MNVLFHENQLTYRGTSVSLYDYAHYNEIMLGNKSYIIYNKNNPSNNINAIQRFEKRFNVFGYTSVEEIDKIIEEHKIDVFYAIKSGEKDDIITKKCRSCMHVVFQAYEPHGDVYAYVSHWLAQTMSNDKAPYVPHIVHLPKEDADLKNDLSIPVSAKVFGYYGGHNSFNIKFVQNTIYKIAKRHPKIYFIFMGVDKFIANSWFSDYSDIKNIIFLPPNTDTNYKVKFINTCDAMLHARLSGETFGIAIGEFAISNKPIITYLNSPEKAHIQMLGDNAFYYHSKKSLKKILLLEDLSKKNAAAQYNEFSPEKVMDKFNKIFLQ
ncbi:MAG: hypothetical protein PW786_07890 [Arachidicoccus sp.]|nr:hypothetical protein [Arachidicoccus sp.]